VTVIAALLLIAVLVWPAPGAAAQPSPPAPDPAGSAPPVATALPAEAERARQLGLAAANAKDWANAVHYFTEAQKRAHLAPPLAYNLGRAHALAGHELAAAAWFRAYVVYLEWKESAHDVAGEADGLAAVRREMSAVVREIRALERAAEARITRLLEEAVKLAELLPVEATADSPEGVRSQVLRVVAAYQYAAGAFDIGNETLARARAVSRAAHEASLSGDKALDLDTPGAPVLLWAMTQAEAGDVLAARANMIRAGGYDGEAVGPLAKLVEAMLVQRQPTFVFEALSRIASQPLLGWLVESAGRILARIGTDPSRTPYWVGGIVGEASSEKIDLVDAIERLAALSVQEDVKSLSGRPLRVLDAAALAYLHQRLPRMAERFAAAARPYDGFYRGLEPYYLPVDFLNGKTREALERLEARRGTSMTTGTVREWLVDNVACLLLLGRADDARRAVGILETVTPWDTAELPAMLALARSYLAIADGRTDEAMTQVDRLPRPDGDALVRARDEWRETAFSHVLPLRLSFPGAAGNKEVAQILALYRAAFDLAVGVGNVEAAVRIADRLPLSAERRAWLRELESSAETMGAESEYVATLTDRQAAALRALPAHIERLEQGLRMGWEPDDPNAVTSFEEAVLAAQMTNHRAVVDVVAVVKEASAAEKPEVVPAMIAMIGYVQARELLRARTAARFP
jgi:hypothetical protein